MSRISLLTGLLAVSSIAFAETRIFITGPSGEEAPTPIVISSVDPDDYTVVLRFWLEDTVSAGLGPLRTVQAKVPCEAAPLGGNGGAVFHDVSGPTACGAVSPCANVDDPDWVWIDGIGLPSTWPGECPCGMDPCQRPTFGHSALLPMYAVDVIEPVYVGEVAYTASLDARGDWGVTALNPDLGQGGDTFLRAEPFANIPFTFADPMAIISIPVAECFDGVQCIGELTKYECLVEQSGVSWEPLYGDIFPLGNPNGTIDFDDVLCVLNGFANAADCPPADIIGFVGACPPENTNGIDFDDILSALDAFAGNPACTLCP